MTCEFCQRHFHNIFQLGPHKRVCTARLTTHSDDEEQDNPPEFTDEEEDNPQVFAVNVRSLATRAMAPWGREQENLMATAAREIQFDERLSRDYTHVRSDCCCLTCLPGYLLVVIALPLIRAVDLPLIRAVDLPLIRAVNLPLIRDADLPLIRVIASPRICAVASLLACRCRPAGENTFKPSPIVVHANFGRCTSRSKDNLPLVKTPCYRQLRTCSVKQTRNAAVANGLQTIGCYAA